MLLKLAALLAAFSHTYHETREELKRDAAEETAGMTQYMLDVAHEAYLKRRDIALSGHEDRKVQALYLYSAASAAEGKKNQAQSIINIVKGNV